MALLAPRPAQCSCHQVLLRPNVHENLYPVGNHLVGLEYDSRRSDFTQNHCTKSWINVGLSIQNSDFVPEKRLQN